MQVYTIFSYNKPYAGPNFNFMDSNRPLDKMKEIYRKLVFFTHQNFSVQYTKEMLHGGN